MLRKILEHKITFAIAVTVCVIVAGTAAYFLIMPQKRVLSNATAQVMDIRQKVSADGQVDSDQHVSLSFQESGVMMSVNIKAVNVQVGDHVHAGEVLVSVDDSDLEAELLGAQADVQSAEANIDSLERGATSQTVAVYDQGVSAAESALSTAVKDAYLKIQDAVLNKISPFFDNNTSANPTVNIITDSSQTASSINNARVDMVTRMTDWDSLIGASATSDQALNESAADIAAAKSLVDSLSTEVDRLTVGNSSMPQSDIDADVAIANGAGTEVNAAETEFDSALQAYKTAADQLNVIQASSTPENLEIAQAALAKAQANVASIRSQISDMTLIAPFDGIVASVVPKAGENFPAGTPAVDIVSEGAYKIDVMVPENEVAGIDVGDEADITFDAGDGLAATGTVASIDLSETVTNGVGAYKATVYLSGFDPRIRTGMNATVTINGVSADNVIAIPASAIVTKNDGSYALVFNKATNSYVERRIETGVTDGNWTEVMSGIQAGEVVAAFGESGQ